MPSDLKKQGEEIQRLCVEAQLTPDEMAQRIALKPESMRKIIRGYQPCSEQLLQAMRLAAELEKVKRAAGIQEPVRGDPKKLEFLQLMRSLGWDAKETARQLHMKLSMVIELANLNSHVSPNDLTLQMFRMLVEREMTEAVKKITAEDKPLPKRKSG
jgi:plasmid maintenance system antidote protein VapI